MPIAVAAASSLALAGPAHAQDPAAPGCPGPYTPVFAFATGPGGTEPPAERSPEDGPSIATPPPVVDTDGDATPDTVTGDGTDVVTIARGDGSLVLSADGRRVAGVGALGDLDGDGRTEVRAVVATDDAGGTTFTSVVVPGATPVGTVDVFDVGVSLPPGGAQAAVPVGDQDGDGVGDVALFVPDASGATRRGLTVVASGADLLAPGPGGALDGTPPTVVDLRGGLAAVLDLGAGEPPTLVDFRIVDGSQEGSLGLVAELTVHLPTPLTLVTARISAPEPDPFSVNRAVSGFRTPDGDRIVRLAGGDRGGSRVLMWNLDDLCSPPVPSSAPVSAPAVPGPQGSGDAAARTELPRTGASAMALGALGTALVGVGSLPVRGTGAALRRRA